MSKASKGLQWIRKLLARSADSDILECPGRISTYFTWDVWNLVPLFATSKTVKSRSECKSRSIRLYTTCEYNQQPVCVRLVYGLKCIDYLDLFLFRQFNAEYSLVNFPLHVLIVYVWGFFSCHRRFACSLSSVRHRKYGYFIVILLVRVFDIQSRLRSHRSNRLFICHLTLNFSREDQLLW